MKKILVLTILLVPAVVFGAGYTKTVKERGTVKVCVPVLTAVALVNQDGETVIETTAERRKPGAKCGRFRIDSRVTPGTYTLETYEPTYSGCGSWSTNCKTTKNNRREIGTIEVVPKKPKN